MTQSATNNIIDTTEGCRYCLMCRHVCPVTRVTFNEATSPHGWALTIASVRRGQLRWDVATTDLLYRCADCGLCQSFCVTDQPLPYAIVAARAEAPITTTGRLAAVIHRVMPRDPSGQDTATRSFQALRIRVNDELGEIERGLAAAAKLLAPGGRLVVVAFHSLEDRLVKRFMAEAAGRGPGASRHDPAALAARPPAPRFALLTPRAVTPSAEEVAANPRARSARLRALRRLPAKEAA